MPRGCSVRTRSLAPIAMAVLILAGATGEALADEQPAFFAGYTLTSWNRSDGLPPGNIWALAQDTRGFLWLGADFGLLRFDGSRFVDADALGLAALPRGGIRTVLASIDGALWIGFANGGISRVRDDVVTTWTTVEGTPFGRVTTIVEEPTGALIAIAGGRLLRFERGKWTRWTHAPVGSALTIHLGPSGDLLLVSDYQVLIRRRGNDTFEVLGDVAQTFEGVTQSVAQDSLGRVWASDSVAGFRLVGAWERKQQSDTGRGGPLLSDRRGNLWIGTFGQGLWHVPVEVPNVGARVERVSELTGLSSSSALSLLEDRDGNVWVGTPYGLDRLRPHRFNHVSDLGQVMGIESTADGSLWAATNDAIVQLVAEGGTLHPIRRYLEAQTTRALHAAGDGTLWAATNQGIYRLRNGRFERVIAQGSFAVRALSAIPADAGGGLWLYDEKRGLLRWRDSKIEAHPLPSSFHNARLSTVFTDRRGRLWLGFDQNRLVAVEPTGELRVLGEPEGLEVGMCRALYEDRSGTVWIVGSRGITRFKDGLLVTLDQGDAFLGTLTSVIDSDEGDLWFGSSWGLIRMHPREIQRAMDGRWADVSYDVFDASDGVSGTTRWMGMRSVARTGDGRLWFVTVRGLTVVDPKALRSTHSRSPMRIEDVIVDGRRMLAAPEINLASNARRLEINFTLPDLTSAAKTRFRYRLDGFDSGWVDAGNRRQAIYTNLPPRPYVFRVEASNQTGAWAGALATWSFAIPPAFYQTGWFYGALAAIVILIGGTTWRLRILTIRNRFALVLGERVRLSREIHDTLLQSLVGVSLQLDQLSHDVGTAEGRHYVTRIRSQVDEYIRDARESIWNLRSPKLERSDLATALRRSGERIANKVVAFDFRMTGVPKRHPGAVEEQLLRIGQEAVTNAVRHSQARRVSMELQYDEQAVTLRVADDGHGFERSQVEDGHWGLQTMEERAAAAGGGLRLSSHSDAGTVIEAVIPVTHAQRM